MFHKSAPSPPDPSAGSEAASAPEDAADEPLAAFFRWRRPCFSTVPETRTVRVCRAGNRLRRTCHEPPQRRQPCLYGAAVVLRWRGVARRRPSREAAQASGASAPKGARASASLLRYTLRLSR